MSLALGLLLLAPPPPVDTVPLTPGMVIDRSVVIRPGRYRLAPAAGDSAVIRVRGSDIDVDFAGASLEGDDPSTPPDRRAGIGLLIEGGARVTIRNARIRGYHVGVLARGVERFALLDSDLSHQSRPRLWSGLGHESLADWLYFHHNERDEWLRYGAAAYLADVRGGEIRGTRALQGMNGLLLARSDDLRIWNNDFSFNSGLGIGLYRSSRNTIVHNRADWCMRGYVHGVYSRGQDSAALLLYEQSSHNVIAWNSLTHSGDGLFLWAGQSTMDTGEGGANDNLIFGNDLSHAAANAVEVTFSRNRIVGNRLAGSNYGIWGGYSFETLIQDNEFADNLIAGVAIEHGQDNAIVGNRFDRDSTAIRLWQNRIEPGDWGYPRHRDTRSRDYRIEGNAFVGNRVALRVAETRNVRLAGNRAAGVDTLSQASGDTAGWRGSITAGVAPDAPPRWRPPVDHPLAPATLPGGMDAMLPPDHRVGRETILVDEWGPYDWRHPKLWPARRADSAYRGGPLTLATLGPPGRWRVVSQRGLAAVTPRAGAIGGSIVVTPSGPPDRADWEVTLEYVGEAVTGPNGERAGRGEPFRFSFARFAPKLDLEVRAAPWDSAGDPRRDPGAMRAALGRVAPLAGRWPALDLMWSRPRLPGFPAERFALSAEGTVELPPGSHELVAIADDGVRVWIDGALAIDHWDAHESAVDRAPVAGGRHRIRVEYYQVSGWVELRLAFLRGPAR